jgi:hypothetical protein
MRRRRLPRPVRKQSWVRPKDFDIPRSIDQGMEEPCLSGKPEMRRRPVKPANIIIASAAELSQHGKAVFQGKGWAGEDVLPGRVDNYVPRTRQKVLSKLGVGDSSEPLTVEGVKGGDEPWVAST